MRMAGEFLSNIYTEPSDGEPDTMRTLGPLTPLAGIWEGRRGLDEHPTADGVELRVQHAWSARGARVALLPRPRTPFRTMCHGLTVTSVT
jgi:hypothetical protein